MSARRPTEEQRRAVERPLEDSLVVAGAGSGKTSVLTWRFLHLLEEEGLPLRRITALTFTEKAALEMRERIAAGLGDRGHTAEEEEIEFAPISTIHAFAARLLRVHSVEAGVDPAFRVLDETEATLLAEDAWRDALMDVAASDPEAVRVLSRIDARQRDLLDLLERVRGAGAEAASLGWASATLVLPGAADLGAAADALAASVASDAVLSREVAAALQEVKEAVAASEDRPWRLVAAAEAVRAVQPAKGRGPRPFTSARKALAEALDLEGARALDLWAGREIAPALVRLLRAVDDRYEARKREEALLDFTDLERRALRLLERRGTRGLCAPPAALLVDEFQDTNPLQAALLARLRGGGTTQFSVGDPKQSIYRFRRADVRVIGEESVRVGEVGRHVLRSTFRARPELVDGLNAMHERLFADGRAGVPYETLVAAGRFRDVPGPDLTITILDGGAGAGARARREGEARWIASTIDDLVRRGVPRARIETDDRGDVIPPRALRYGDVAVLFRARKDLPAYEDALAARGIPFHTHKGRGFFQAEEIVDLLYALRVIHDPADDHAFACFAAGPILAVEDLELLRLFGEGADARGGAGVAWERFRAGATGRTLFVTRTIERLRAEAIAGRLARVVESVLDDLGLLEVALLQPDGARRAANLRKAVAIARGLERAGREDLGDLLRTLARLRDREVAEAVAETGGEEEDRVALLTVHGAKGLEFPVVLLADVGRPPAGARERVGYDGKTSFAVGVRHPLEGTTFRGTGFDALREEERRLEAEESRRLLYVASTRAEERLYLVGTAAGRSKQGTFKQLSGWGADLLGLLGTPAGTSSVALPWGRCRATLSVEDLPASDEGSRASPDVLPPLEPTRDADEEARRVLAACRTPVAPLRGTPFSVTVTELLRFARSPRRSYLERLEGAGGDRSRAVAPPEPGDPASGTESTGEEAGRREERLLLWHEPPDRSGGIDRPALGRALHRLLERFVPGRPLGPDEIQAAMEEEFPGGAPGTVLPRLALMVERFRSAPVGVRLAEALARGDDVRRELGFHVRIRFPAGTRVGPFEALLVRGSIDLWLPTKDGVRIVDHKTNPPTPSAPTPEAVGEAYAWQLRLYALAAERLLGEDVAGASLLLLDPGWGDAAVEVPVDVGGPKLEDARRLVQAYATAELEGRWPDDWRSLVDT